MCLFLQNGACGSSKVNIGSSKVNIGSSKVNIGSSKVTTPPGTRKGPVRLWEKGGKLHKMVTTIWCMFDSP